MFINLLRIAIIFFTFGTVDILETYTLHSIDDIAYEELTYRDIFEELDVIGVGKNLFDKSDENVTLSKYVDVNGSILNSGAGNAVSGYIRVKPSTVYIKSGLGLATNYGAAYYDKDKNFILYQSSSTGSFTTPSNAYYYRFTFFGTSIDTVQLELGTVATTYEEYFDSCMIINGTTTKQLSDIVHWFGLENFDELITQEELNLMLNYYLINKDNPSYEYTFKTLGIEHLILFITSMLFWYYSLKLLRKAVK